MHRWIYTPSKVAAIRTSSALSLVAHAVLIGAAVYSTGVRAHQLEEEVSRRVAFLPPPDRRPSMVGVREKLQYIAVGGGVPQSPLATETAPLADDGRSGLVPIGNVGRDATSEVGSEPFVSPDSVYSVLEVEDTATRAEDGAAPAYPPAMVKVGREGRVQMRYVVDTTGYVDLAASEVLLSTDPAFTLAVREVLPQMRFTPAMVKGRPVRQLVEQEFAFRIAATTPDPAEQTRKAPRKP